MIETLKSLTVALGALVLMLSAYIAGTNQPAQLSLGSVGVTDDYTATTTSAITVSPTRWLITATSSTDTSSHTGTFGSFVQTAAGTAGGNINIYDATTTNASKRFPQATSSVLLVSLPTAAAAGTYTFDVEYKRGLLVVTDGTVGTTTITFRPIR